MIARAPSQSSMVAWPATPKFCTTPITFLSSALPLSSTLRPWPSSVPVTSSIYRPEERLMFAASFTVAPASMVVGNSSAEATVTASLALATHTARLLVFGVVFGILRLVSISLVLPKRSCERGILANHGVGGNYRIKDRLMRWKTTSRLITHVCPNKQRRTGMRENGKRERAIENNPHGFWHRFGRATRRHSEDGNSKGSDFGIRPNHTQRLFSRQISSKRSYLQKEEVHTLPKSLEQ